MDKILFINGINTTNGGAGSLSLRNWDESLSKKNTIIYINLYKNFFNNKVLNILINTILLFPGIFFRCRKIVFFEFFYKFSIFYSLYIILKVICIRPDKIIFSHHSSFYLSFFLPSKYKKTFIIHDLLAFRQRTLLQSNFLTKFIFHYEVFLYKKCDCILIQSRYEYLVLKKIIRTNNIFLITTMKLNSIKNNNLFINNDFFIAADWRRFENRSGLKKFINDYKNKKIIIHVWGLGYDKLNILNTNKNIKFVFDGLFQNFTSIPQSNLIVPIYEGSGIKIKVIEAIRANKIIYSSKQGLTGIYGIKSPIVNSIESIGKKSNVISDNSFTDFYKSYNSYFEDISNCI